MRCASPVQHELKSVRVSSVLKADWGLKKLVCGGIRQTEEFGVKKCSGERDLGLMVWPRSVQSKGFVVRDYSVSPKGWR